MVVMSVLRNVSLLFCLLSAFYCAAQDTSFTHIILERITLQQVVNARGFTQGNFPSYISNTPLFKKNKKDDDVFFAALINYTLQRQYQFLSVNNRLLSDSIQQRSQYLYSHYQNKTGRLTYNFWRTDTAVLFPYTKWIRRIKKNTSLPDDMDDTVLSLLAQDTDSTKAEAAHALMQLYTNTDNNSKTIEKKYRCYNTYSVWYGKNFKPVFDVCVLCNILCFVQQYHLTWTHADSAALNVIVQAVTSRDYVTKPVYISPYYGTTSLILYHVARLMSYAPVAQLDSLKQELIAAATRQLNNSSDLLEKVILSSALMKWNQFVPAIKLPSDKQAIQDIEHSNQPFFTGNIPSYFPLLYKHFFTREKWLLFYHYCPAFNDVLLLEYLCLQQNFSARSKE